MRFFCAPIYDSSLIRCVQNALVLSGGILLMAVGLWANQAYAQAAPEGEERAVDATSEPLIDDTPLSALEEAQRTIRDANALLDSLADSEDGREADVLARQIQSLWNESGSDAVDLLMRRASVAVQVRNFALALDLLDTVIALAPDYAEGWNRRATVHYLRDDYALSISDVAEVLRLEPRHFGALIGIGVMLDEMGQDRQAQQFIAEALRVHPYLSGARERLSSIERRLEGAPI